jgi:hypothetical protein
MPFGISAGTAALIGGGISAVGSVAGGLIQSGTAGKAGAQAQRNLQMILPQMQTNFVNTLAGYQPYTEAGQQGLTATTDLLGLNGPDAADAAMKMYQTSPGYQWQMEQGLRGVDAGAASKGILRSGATIKAEDTFAQGLANSDFGQYYNRLSALSGQGLTAAGGVATANQNLIANEEGNATAQNTALTGTANAQNSILGNTASGLGNTVNSLLTNPDVRSTVGGWFGGGGVAAPGPNTTTGGYTIPAAQNTWV